MMYGFIYITTNLVNGKQYIGQRKITGTRTDETYLGSGRALLNAVKNYGKENFVRAIIEYHATKVELDNAEIAAIALHNAVEDRQFYNIASGGSTPNLGIKHTDETRARMSASHMGHVHSEETRTKLREANVGQKRDPHVFDGTRARCSVPIRCIETGTIFPSLTAAANSLGCAKSLIGNQLRKSGRAKTAKGFTFEYVDGDSAQRSLGQVPKHRKKTKG